jgi:hypothetical protein
MNKAVTTRLQYSKRQVAAQIILFMIIAFITLPDLFVLGGSGLDNSWRFALHRITLNGLRYGRDIVVTYGPLGYFRIPFLISEHLWLKSVAYTIANHVLFFFSLFLFIRRERSNWINVFYLIITVFISFCIVQTVLGFAITPTIVSLFIFDYLYINTKKTNILFGLLLGIHHSALLYTKFDDGGLHSMLNYNSDWTTEERFICC